jgi:hypothetical protein
VAEETEVKTRLVLDDLASATLQQIRKGFSDTDKEQKKTQGGFVDGMQRFAGSLRDFYQGVVPALQMAKDFGASLVMPAIEGEQADAALGALIATVQDIPFDRAKQEAAGLGDTLDELAMRSGVATNDIGAGFQTLVEITGASEKGIAQATKTMDQLAIVAGVTGQSVDGMAREMAFMQEGMLKTRGPMFQMLQQTGIFGDDIRKAAAGWQTLTETERLNRLSFAMEQLSGKLRDAEPSFAQMTRQLEAAWDVMKEQFGEPLLEAFLPVLQDVVGELKGSSLEIRHFARTLGREAGQWLKEALRTAREFYETLRTHAEEIKDAFRTGLEVAQFIIEHKEVMAAAFGAGALVPKIGAAAGAQVGGGGQLATMAAAIGVGALVEQLEQAQREGVFQTGLQKDILARQETLLAAAQRGELGEEQQVQLNELMALMREAEVKKLAAQEARGDIPYAVAEEAVAGRAMKNVSDYIEHLETINLAIANWKSTMKDAADIGWMGATKLAEEFEMATARNSLAQQQYIAGLIIGSKDMQSAFAHAGMLTEQGFADLIAVIEKMAPEVAEAMKKMKGEEEVKKAEKQKNVFNFSGPINIKQDFRDQDPDRVAVAFREDLRRAAETVTRARTGLGFAY